MTYWLVRFDAPSITVEDDSKKIFIRSKRAPRIARGDHVLLVKNKLFHSLAVVESRSTPAPADQFGDLLETTINVEEWTLISDGLPYDLQAFSLSFVRNFERPYVHFSRGYRTLKREDFETITGKKIFLARTAYLELYHALPQVMQREFDYHEAMNSLSNRSEPRYSYRLFRLREFIETRILEVGAQLKQMTETLDSLELKDGERRSVSHYFANVDENPNDLFERTCGIREQTNFFEELDLYFPVSTDPEPSGNERNVFDEVFAELQNSQTFRTEDQFERLFRSTT